MKYRAKCYGYRNRHLKCFYAFLMFISVTLSVNAQFNTERVMIMGRSALYYEDYVLSIQRFSLVINAKPHLAEPYFFRGLAKFYLEDFTGAESDVSNAITRNPYTANYYVLRGLCRINNKKFEEAEQDYVKSIEIEPSNEDSWHNMVLCQIEQEAYLRADSCLNVMINKWPKVSNNYTIKSQVWLAREDTVEAEKWVDRALEINNFDGSAWSIKSMMLLKRNDYSNAEEALNKAILQSPRLSDLYINRAMARYYQDNLRGAMSDYDVALEINNRSLIGHFNRALLRSQVGDDNRAIEDFNFVIEHESDNYVAIYNRALLLNNTGNYKAAMEDLTTILNEYPNFWDGYSLRASIRRKIGDKYGAERDEFKVLKARMEGSLAGKKRSSAKTRKESDQSLEDYNKLVEADKEEYHEQYANEYRGKVQDRDTDTKPVQSYVLSYHPNLSFGHETSTFHPLVEAFSKSNGDLGNLQLTNNEYKLTGNQSEKYFEDISKQTEIIEKSMADNVIPSSSLMLRALDYYCVRDFESAIIDLDILLGYNSHDVLGLFLRAQMRVALYANVEELSNESKLELQKAADDLKEVYHLDKDFVCALFNEANIFYYLRDYEKASKLYSEVLNVEPQFAEAYYNRGLSLVMMGRVDKGLADLSQAGEYGIYTAYNLIKKYSKK